MGEARHAVSGASACLYLIGTRHAAPERQLTRR